MILHPGQGTEPLKVDDKVTMTIPSTGRVKRGVVTQVYPDGSCWVEFDKKTEMFS